MGKKTFLVKTDIEYNVLWDLCIWNSKTDDLQNSDFVELSKEELKFIRDRVSFVKIKTTFNHEERKINLIAERILKKLEKL